MLAYLEHFTRMAFKAMLRFKMHTVISQLSLIFGFVCFISAALIKNYVDDFDQHFPNAERIFNIVQVDTANGPQPDNFPIVNEPAARYLRAAFPEIPNIAQASMGFPQDITIDGVPHVIQGKYVEERYFDIFPLETISGIDTGEALPPNSVLIMEAAAQRLFGRTDVVGERMLISNSADVRIAGVARFEDRPSHMKAAVSFFETEVFIPIEIQQQEDRKRIIAAGGDPDADRWGNQSHFVHLEIPEDMPFSVPEFNQRLDEFVKTILPEDRREFMTYGLLPINQVVMSTIGALTGGFDISRVLFFAGALVLLIGCLNYSNLVIAQLSLRSQEIGVQKILGSKRSLLIVQYCYEALLFVGMAMLLALLLFLFLLNSFDAQGVVGVGPYMLFDPALWLSLGGVMLVIVLIAGVYPALRTATVPLVSMMRPKGSSGYSGRLRSLMVGSQFFISGTLMILALVMFAQNNTMTDALDGKLADPTIVITTPMDTSTVDQELLEAELKRHPGVIGITHSDRIPWQIGNSSSSFFREPHENSIEGEISRTAIGFDYFSTTGTRLIAGREFSRDRANDAMPPYSELTANSGPYAVIINNTTAQSMGWESAEAAIGASIYYRIGPPTLEQDTFVEMEIIGAAERPKFELIDFGTFGVQGSLYLLQPFSSQYMIIKLSRSNLNDSLVYLEDTWRRLMPGVGLQREFTDDVFYESYNIFLAISFAITGLSMAGFLIASIGLVGNATFMTNIRQKEVGIRKVMGASSGRLLRMLLLDFAKPILIANALAFPLGFVIANGYISIFANRTEISIWPFLISLLLAASIAFAAIFSQSWKSSRVRPAMILRYE